MSDHNPPDRIAAEPPVPIVAPIPTLPYTYPPMLPLPPRAPAPPRVWPVFVAVLSVFPVMFGVWIVAFAAMFLLCPPNATLTPEQSQQRIQNAIKNPNFLIPILIAISLGNLGIALCGGWLSPLKPRLRLGLGQSAAGWGALFLLAIGTLAAGEAAINIVQLIGIHADQGTNELLNVMARNATPAQYATLLVVVSVFPAVCEELLFRGYCQTRLVARWGSFWGIGISAVMFGLIHMDPVQTPDMVFLGSYLGWTAFRIGSTRTSMGCHLINNLAAIGLSALGSKAGEAHESASKLQLVFWIALGLLICGACTWIANRLIPPRVWKENKPEFPPVAEAV
jgi:membrane protease YdiL (CAAX protease family)